MHLREGEASSKSSISRRSRCGSPYFVDPTRIDFGPAFSIAYVVSDGVHTTIHEWESHLGPPAYYMGEVWPRPTASEQTKAAQYIRVEDGDSTPIENAVAECTLLLLLRRRPARRSLCSVMSQTRAPLSANARRHRQQHRNPFTKGSCRLWNARTRARDRRPSECCPQRTVGAPVCLSPRPSGILPGVSRALPARRARAGAVAPAGFRGATVADLSGFIRIHIHALSSGRKRPAVDAGGRPTLRRLTKGATTLCSNETSRDWPSRSHQCLISVGIVATGVCLRAKNKPR